MLTEICCEGFVTFKTISEAHRIARTHQGRLKELYGARLALAPPPHDIVWENISREPAEVKSRRILGFISIAVVCFFNTLPVRLSILGFGHPLDLRHSCLSSLCWQI